MNKEEKQRRFGAEYQRGYYASKKEKFKEYNRKYIAKNREAVSNYRYFWGIKKKYGITQREYESILESQGGSCAICGKNGGRRLDVDHHHESGKIRGLLCIPCNLSIGKMRESPELLRSAANYLEKFSC